ncbi:MAG: AAA family ATPase [Synergistaceae bacterium]|nr:AAA family ATPase [Synergistaceae bacterium]
MQILKAKDLTQDKITALFYAPPGLGKTTLLGTLKGKTLIIDVDRGTSVLTGSENVDIIRLSEDFSELPEILKELQAKCDYNNVCIDSLSELERGMLAYFGRIGKNNGVPDMQSYQRVDFKIVDWCRQFRSLPCNMIFTAWEKQAEVIAVTGEKYTQARPQLRDKNIDNVCGLCDIVGQILVSPKDGERYVKLEGDQNTVAKDRIKKRKFMKFGEEL